jgi:hypothetical protein
MKVWITQYALTKGILELEAEVSSASAQMVTSKNENGYVGHFHKPHWHERKQDAIDFSNGMRLRKIAGLKKQITKLENLTFK